MRYGCLFTLGGAALFAALLWAALHWSYITIPPNTLPWRPVVLDAEPGWFAHLAINRLAHDRGACLSALNSAAKLSFSPMQDRKTSDGCGYTNVVRADSTPVIFNYHPTATCALIAALYWWERDLQKLAQAQFQSRITHITQLGTFACRNVNSESSGSRSKHATANAIDIQNFTLANGTRISIQKDWGTDTPKGRFLKAAHDSACRVFNGVLSPDYNALHATHFHLDVGPYLICR